MRDIIFLLLSGLISVLLYLLIPPLTFKLGKWLKDQLKYWMHRKRRAVTVLKKEQKVGFNTRLAESISFTKRDPRTKPIQFKKVYSRILKFGGVIAFVTGVLFIGFGGPRLAWLIMFPWLINYISMAFSYITARKIIKERYEFMQSNEVPRPSYMAMADLKTIGRLVNLYAMSDEIAMGPGPVDLIVSTLDYVIQDIEARGPNGFKLDDDNPQSPYNMEKIINDGAKLVATVLDYGLPIPENTPYIVESEGRKLFHQRTGGIPSEYAGNTRNPMAFSAVDRLIAMQPDFERYEFAHEFKITPENYDTTLTWLKQELRQFSHDLKTSRLLTDLNQIEFYVSNRRFKEVTQAMGDDKLLSTYKDCGDYLSLKHEMGENVRLANNFEYEHRDDLTLAANQALEEWYNRNRSYVKKWKRDVDKFEILSKEIIAEIDQRGLRGHIVKSEK